MSWEEPVKPWPGASAIGCPGMDDAGDSLSPADGCRGVFNP